MERKIQCNDELTLFSLIPSYLHFKQDLPQNTCTCCQTLITFCVIIVGFNPVCLGSMFVRWTSVSHFLWPFLGIFVFLWQTTSKTTTKVCHSFAMCFSICICHIQVSDNCESWLVLSGFFLVWKLVTSSTRNQWDKIIVLDCGEGKNILQ